MKRTRQYVRYFVLGLILAALALGSVAIKATHPQTPPEAQTCHPFGTGRCETPFPNPTPPCEQRTTSRCIYPYKKLQLGECPQPIEPCSLDAAKTQG